jgi:hypothetical protein
VNGWERGDGWICGREKIGRCVEEGRLM